MVTFQASSGAETIVTSCFQLRFWYHEDRWRHEITSAGATASIPRLASVEAGADGPEVDPGRVISPTYQQIHLDRDPVGAVRAFLVGQAGPHHFSAVFLVTEDASGAAIDVDVADRCLAPVLGLAATYAVERSPGTWGTVASAGPAGEDRSSLVLDATDPVCQLIWAVDPPGQHGVLESHQGRIQVQALARIDPSQQTHRFRYRWCWIKDPDPAVRDQPT